MPRAARTTKKKISSGSEEESTDVEATPKQKKTTANKARLKRRVSGFQLDEADDEEQQRIPLKSFNEELIEKRSLKRRKSSRMTMAFDPDAVSQENQELDQDASASTEAPKKSALARANQLKSVVAPGPMVPVSLEIMTSNFEEWMKMATDNKINANNSWSFALIDYFHDMSLLRNDGDNSINFQKASRTLDGCVKIWTSRVDSVGTDTGKLLSNLATEGKIVSEDPENEEGEGADGGEAAKKRKASRQEATLAKNPAQLQTKKLDLEFTIDPLFKKTSGDFDEGGAQGLLMNHLGVDGFLRVIFDAMDTPGGAEVEGEDQEVVSLQVPLADLRAKLDYPSLSYRLLQSERLSNFKFSASADATSTKYTVKDEDLDSEDEAAFQNPPDVSGDGMDIVNEENNVPPEEPQDFFAGDEGGIGDVGDYGGYGGDEHEGEYGDTNEDPSGMQDGGEESQRSGVHPMGHTLFDPRKPPDQRELVMAMNQDGGASMLDYFDSNITRNWAGPEHWKLRKVIRKPDKAEQPTAPKQRKEKEPFSIDFSEELPDDFEKKLFEPPAKGSITLPAKQCAYIGGKKKKNQEKRDNFLLPEDMHFSSKQLLSLFLKPKFMINFRGHRTWLRPDNDEEIDENFWAKAAADAALPPDDDNMNPEGDGMPFATQYFNDDDDDGGGGFDDAYGGGEGMAGAGIDEGADLLAATQGQVRRVRPEFVNYAKKVKRVDVRKLKENIWKGLDIVLPEEAEERSALHSSKRKPTAPDEAKRFTSVISDLRKTYPKDKMDEISTSFCFICLLHLANERGLKLEGEDDNGLGAKMSGLRLSNSARRMMEEDDPDADDDATQDDSAKISDIWGLRIYRDPDAIPSA